MDDFGAGLGLLQCRQGGQPVTDEDVGSANGLQSRDREQAEGAGAAADEDDPAGGSVGRRGRRGAQRVAQDDVIAPGVEVVLGVQGDEAATGQVDESGIGCRALDVDASPWSRSDWTVSDARGPGSTTRTWGAEPSGRGRRRVMR